MAWKQPLPCPECKSVLCHTASCSTGQARRKGLAAPPVNKMVQAAPRRKSLSGEETRMGHAV